MQKPKSFTADRAEANRKAYDQQRGSSYDRGYGGKAWGWLRQQVFMRDGYRCQDCGEMVGIAPGDAHCDHIIERDKGGPDAIDNLRTLCPRCHGRKTRMEHRGGV